MKEAVVRIRKLSKEESELMIEEAIEKNRRDKVAEIEYARDEGLEQGMREGIEKGMERGKREGIEQGMEKGKREGMELVAVNMLKKKLDIAVISEITGWTVEEIKKLKNDS